MKRHFIAAWLLAMAVAGTSSASSDWQYTVHVDPMDGTRLVAALLFADEPETYALNNRSKFSIVFQCQRKRGKFGRFYIYVSSTDYYFRLKNTVNVRYRLDEGEVYDKGEIELIGQKLVPESALPLAKRMLDAQTFHLELSDRYSGRKYMTFNISAIDLPLATVLTGCVPPEEELAQAIDASIEDWRTILLEEAIEYRKFFHIIQRGLNENGVIGESQMYSIYDTVDVLEDIMTESNTCPVVMLFRTYCPPHMHYAIAVGHLPNMETRYENTSFIDLLDSLTAIGVEPHTEAFSGHLLRE